MATGFLYAGAAALVIIWVALTSCTVNYSITNTLTDTHGTASDVVDETSSEKATTETEATANISAKPF